MITHEIVGDDMQACKGDREEVECDMGGALGALGRPIGGDS